MKITKIYFVITALGSLSLCYTVGLDHLFWYAIGCIGALISGFFLADKYIPWF